MKRIIRLTEQGLIELVLNVINESRWENEDEINRVLDKINKEGINSLTRSELLILKNSETSDYSSKEEIISMISEKVSECGYIGMGELYADTSIMLSDTSEGISLIEGFYDDRVKVVVYGGYKNEKEIDEYNMLYDELTIDILEEILTLIEDYECED
jgi:hypothetical protein